MRKISVDVEKIRRDFPILKRHVRAGKPLTYLDNAATSQKPECMISAMAEYYRDFNANVHRGIYELSEEATERYEESRKIVAELVNAKSPKEIIFVRNTTEALNLIAYSYGLKRLRYGDEVVSTVMEHHSNILPWQLLQANGVKLKFVDIDDQGTLRMDQYDRLVDEKTRIVTVTHISNVLGTINRVREIGKIAHQSHALFVVDAAQSVPHLPVDVREIDCDFLVFSAHKMLGPTGVGVLYGKEELLGTLDPFIRGGDMIKEVSLAESTWNDLPWKFEGGTPDIAGVIGFGAAVSYIGRIGMMNIRSHERELTHYALQRMSEVDGLVIYGPKDVEIRSGVISFNLKGVHPHDVATILDEEGVAIRSGHHCAQPLMKRLGIVATARASFYIYNTYEEIDRLVTCFEKVKRVFNL